MMKIKTLIFDFDGLIIDSETPTLRSWQEIFQSYDLELPMEEYYLTIGTTDHLFDPLENLIQHVDDHIDKAEIKSKHRSRMLDLINENDLLPGIEDYLIRAKQIDLRIGIASSGVGYWINQLLELKKISQYFDCVVTSDMVKFPKPEPDLYLRALQLLDTLPQQAIAFEDSPNGISAAKQAGIFCVAIPNQLTQNMDLSQADLLLDSLKQKTLDKLIWEIENQSRYIS